MRPPDRADPTATTKSASPERREKFQTRSHIEIKPCYGPADLAGFSPERDLGYPGEFPFTRGVHPTMYRSRLWTMRQYAGYGTAAESNRRFRYLLSQGQTGLSVAFDLPTQIGYDSDHPRALGEVGRAGVAIDSLADMEELVAGIPLDQVSTSMTINATAAILLAFYVAVAKRQGAEVRKLSGTVQNDILKEYIARGTYIYPPRAALRLVTDIMAYCQQELPEWNTISISGYHIREAGATAVQEVAFTLGNALAYVRAAVERGLNVDDFAPRISFFFNAHSNFFEEVAKFRAARRLWSRLVRERFPAKHERSLMLRFHAQTAGSSLTAQQPDVNVVRTTLEGLAAVLGGCQSLHCNGRDEALGLPTTESALLALRTQQVIAQESGVTDTVDPLAGAYFIEALTEETERRVRQYLERIEALGGMLEAVEKGYVQREIQEAAFEYQQAVERGEQEVVGINRFGVEEEASVPTLRIDPELERAQVERVRKLRLRRDNAVLRRALERVEEAARNGTNLMPAILEAAETYATVGEISDTLRCVFGEYRETVIV
ncbi:MAG: acyl-CoA mutase large subunit family protein [Candidatus Acidiferrales bacterium]